MAQANMQALKIVPKALSMPCARCFHMKLLDSSLEPAILNSFQSSEPSFRNDEDDSLVDPNDDDDDGGDGDGGDDEGDVLPETAEGCTMSQMYLMVEFSLS